MPTKQELREKLIKKLQELFQLDQPDLDFGFYRIMHAKANQVTAFLQNDLFKIVEDAFADAGQGQAGALKSAYEKAVADAREYGVADPEATEPVKKAKAAYESALIAGDGEAEVYEHLYRFFERYYDDGDFISRRYYVRETDHRAAPFAIPYHGEEVKLHWANSDQHYIKTTKHFRNYSFDLRAAVKKHRDPKAPELFEVAEEPLIVHFKVVDADEGEHGNVKASDDKKRFFILNATQPVGWNAASELEIRFEYRSDPDHDKEREQNWRERLNEQACEAVLNAITAIEGADAHTGLLRTKVPTEKQKDRTLLRKYIDQYTSLNTMDYFIHKNLGGFLRRELDFYLKNEVMRLDDIASAEVPAVEQYLRKLKVIRKVSHEIIDFLAQLEEFQKKLWLKKKFVTETQYCITLDRVPESLYAEITANEAQRKEWVWLFSIDEIQRDLVQPGYSEPLTVAFLKANDKLVLDTRFFSFEFKEQLIASIENLDEQCNGLLVNSENLQALNLILNRYREGIDCIYIDPPYNTGGDGFAYKDSYQHSSWLTMITERLEKANQLLSNKGVLYSSIDHIERSSLEYALNDTFGKENRVEEIIWVQNTTKNQSPTFSTNHEYIEVFAKNVSVAKADFKMFRESKPGCLEIIELMATMNPEYPPIVEIEKALMDLFKSHKVELASEGEKDDDDPWKGIYNYNRAEYRDENGKYLAEADARTKKGRIWVWREDNPSMPQIKEDSQKKEFRDPEHPTFRFYEPIHPITGKPSPSPKRGWSWPYLPHGKQKNSFSELAADFRIAWGDSEKKVPQTKRFLHEVETNVAKSVVKDFTDGEKELTEIFGKTRSFAGPKPTTLIARFVQQVTDGGAHVLDFFSGSGTTAHSVMTLNREDSGKRKFILIEMGSHFETVIKPRIAKIAYAPEWQDGKPKSRDVGLSFCSKYIYIESFEDTLNNLVIKEDTLHNEALEENEALQRDYLIHYLLESETSDSPCLMNMESIADPNAYSLEVKTPGQEGSNGKAIDLLETFNYLIGLRVIHIAAPEEFEGQFKREHDPELPSDQTTRLMLDGKLKPSKGGKWWFRKVEGWVPSNLNDPKNGEREKVLIVWRKLSGDLEEDNVMLDEWFKKYRIDTQDREFDRIYVNGSNNLPNLKREGDRWTVELIEGEFHRRMWDIDTN